MDSVNKDEQAKRKGSAAPLPEQNIWNSILNEASRSVDRLEYRNVIVLGDRGAGKSTLLASLQGIDVNETGKGMALDYSYIDVHSNDDDEPIARLNIWQLEGENEHKDLLNFAINEKSIDNSLILIVADFSQPWNLIQSLRRWFEVISAHVQSVHKKMNRNTVEDLKNNILFEFQQYTMPNKEDAGTQKVQKITKKKKFDENLLLPPGEGCLTTNLGIPIVAVCTKTDMVNLLEKEYGFRDPHFEYIHPMVRRVCLEYGAALMYVSSKKERNIDILMDYIKHKLFGFEFTVRPIIEVKETLFIPSGHDSMNKIKVDFENQNLTKEFDGEYQEIIRIPKNYAQKGEDDEPLMVAEEDHEFFEKWKEIIDKEPVVKKSVSTTPVVPTTPEKASTPNAYPQPTTPVSAEKPAAAEHKMYEQFFDNLKTKDPRKPFPLELPSSVTSKISASPILKPLPAGLGGSSSTSPAAKSTTLVNGMSYEEIAKQLERVKGGKS